MAERSEAVEQQAVRDGSAAYSVEADIAVAEDIPPGYRRTEVGVVPEDWDVCKLKKLLSAPPSYGINAAATRYDESLPAYLRITDIDDEGRFSPDPPVSVNHKSADVYFLNRGDLVFARTGASVGKSYEYNPADGRLVYAGFLIRVSPDSSRLDPTFLSNFCRTGLYWNWVKSVSLRSGQPGINGSEYGSLLVPVPPITEQRAIATALSDADALIESLDRLIVKKRAIKQAAMQQLLTGQTRLPGFTGEWETKRLGEISTIAMGRTPSRNNTAFWGRGHVWLSIADLHGKVVSESKEQITNLAAAGMTPIPEGTLLMSFKLSIGRLCFAGCDLFTNEAICSFTNLQADAEFIYYALGRTDFSIYGKQAVKGYTLNSESLKLVKVLLPPENEQIAIAAVLSDMDTEIEALLRRRDKARQIKQGMMQQLLTGRVRLVNSVGRKLSNRKPRSGKRKANVHFMRSVFAAEIVDQLHQEPTFGHVKLQKVLFLAEHLCDVDTGSTYNRKAAGPYDNRALRSIDSQMHRQRWFEARKEGGRYRYIPLDKRGYHKEYFDRYFCHVRELFAHIVEIFRKLDTERCEIVATLYSAWDDLLREQAAVSDEMIIHEVLNNWHESKNRIPRDRWAKALSWMREMGFVPKSRLANE